MCRSCGAHYLKGYYEQDDEMMAAMVINKKSKANGRGSTRKATRKAEKKLLPDMLTLSANQPYKKTFQEIYVHLRPIDENKREDLHVDDEASEGEETEALLDNHRIYLVCPYCLVAHAEEFI